MEGMMTETQTWLTAREACEYLRISYPTLYRWRRDGQLVAHYTPSRRMRFRIEDLEDAIRRKENR